MVQARAKSSPEAWRTARYVGRPRSTISWGDMNWRRASEFLCHYATISWKRLVPVFASLLTVHLFIEGGLVNSVHVLLNAQQFAVSSCTPRFCWYCPSEHHGTSIFARSCSFARLRWLPQTRERNLCKWRPAGRPVSLCESNTIKKDQINPGTSA